MDHLTISRQRRGDWKPNDSPGDEGGSDDRLAIISPSANDCYFVVLVTGTPKTEIVLLKMYFSLTPAHNVSNSFPSANVAMKDFYHH